MRYDGRLMRDDARRVCALAPSDSRGAPEADWRPSLGAWFDGDVVRFRVWAPTRARVDLVLDPDGAAPRRLALDRGADGAFTGAVGGLAPGDLYAYSPDGEGPFPDPASRFQPRGVHGPSAIVDSRRYAWSDAGWRGVPLDRAIVYELHVGTFTPAGTCAAVVDRLPHLVELGVTVVELMPVADFPGARNWGYDGVSLFAPSRAYGTPEDLRRLVDRAHQLGLAVILDLVYNHFGPDGAYAAAFSPRYVSTRHRSPWGAAVNFDGEDSSGVRAFFIENALHWLHEYHIDGFRLDATHAVADDSRRHVLAELTACVKAAVPDRETLVIAEDDRNLSIMVRPAAEGGWGLDAVWADDLHHQLRRLTAGDADGYYADYSGTLDDVAATIRDGWFYRGQHSEYRRGPRGTSSEGVPRQRMVVCLQNHDQIGNRAFGERLTATVPLGTFRALTALLLFVPETPLLFMGQEWAASSPFLYFTDHGEALGRLVTEGRRSEFARFASFADPALRDRIPDPQALSTVERSRLDWLEMERPPHAGVLALHRALTALRRQEPALRPDADVDVSVQHEASCLVVTRRGAGGALQLVACLPGRDAGGCVCLALGGQSWEVVLTTDDQAFAEGGSAPAIRDEAGECLLVFERPAAVILRGA